MIKCCIRLMMIAICNNTIYRGRVPPRSLHRGLCSLASQPVSLSGFSPAKVYSHFCSECSLMFKKLDVAIWQFRS